MDLSIAKIIEKATETAWRACLAAGLLLLVLAATGTVFSTSLRVEHSELIYPIFVIGALLTLTPIAVVFLEARRTQPAPAGMSGFNATFKEPQPDKKYAPPIKLTGTINKKLPDGLKLWLVNEGNGFMRWPQKEVKVQSDNWKNWSVEYDPKNFSDNDERTLRIYVVGQSGLALLQAYNHINKFYKKDLAQRFFRRRISRAAPGGRSGITTLTEDMKPVSPTISFRLSKAP